MISIRTSILLPLLWCCLLASRSTQALQSCDQAVSCCECVRSPGCSWFYSPTLTRPYCSASNSATSSDQNEASEARTPFGPPELIVTRASPINFSRRRLITPQKVTVSANVGVSEYVQLQVMSRSRTVKLRVVGPWEGIEFKLYTARPDMCHPSLMRRESSRSAQRNRGNRRRPNSRSRERPERQGVECVTTAPGELNHFKVLVSVVACFTGTKVIRVIPMSPGQRSAPLRIRVNAICQCPCELNVTEAVSSSPDSSTPARTVAQEDGSCMNSCELPETGGEEAFECIRPLVPELCGSSQEPERPLCSNQGICLCGECMCNPIAELNESAYYSGRTCECNNYNCPMSSTSQMCGGLTQGTCQCGQCVCRPGWQGPACACPDDQNLCRTSPDGPVCGGVGTCVCGECQCPRGYRGPTCDDGGISTSPDGPCSGRGLLVDGVCECREPYEGEQCEHCPRCVDVRCEQHRQCVACRVFPFLAQQEGLCDSCHLSNDIVNREEVIFQPHSSLGDADNLCVYYERTCAFEFYHQTLSNRTIVIHYNSFVRTLDGSTKENPSLTECTMPPPVSSSGGGGGVF